MTESSIKTNNNIKTGLFKSVATLYRNARIKNKLILLVMFILIIFSIIISIVSIKVEKQNEFDRLNNKIIRINKQIEYITIEPLWDLDIEKLKINLESFFSDPEIIKIKLKEYKGNLKISLKKKSLPGIKTIKKTIEINKDNNRLGNIEIIYSTKQVYKKINNIIAWRIMITLLLILLVSLVLFIATKTILDPINKIVHSLDMVDRGDLDYVMDLNTKDEFNDIEIYFNRMVANIKKQYEKIQRQNDELESANMQMEAANLQMEAANEELEATNEELEATNEELIGTNDAFQVQNDELIKTQMGLKTSEENLKKMIELSPYPIAIIYLNKEISYINREFVKIIGYTLDEIKDIKNWWPLAYPDPVYRRQVKKKWESAIDTAFNTNTGIEPREWKVMCKDGSEKIIEFRMAPIGDTALIIMNDLTQVKQSQEIMIHTEKMMTVGGLAAGIAHEINNPLGIIMQGVQVCLNRLSGDNKKNHETAKKIGVDLDKIKEYFQDRGIIKYMEEIHIAGSRAARIVSSMLQFSRKSESKISYIDINKLLDDSLDMAYKDYDLKKEYDFRNIKIIKEYGKNLPPLPCFAMEIEQVSINLLKNASHAMLKQKKDGFKPQITIKTGVRKNFIVFEIIDNGPGIEEKVAKRIFEPFFTTKDVGAGTGLGLYVSYFIITTHHSGAISVESEPGKGSKFIVELPVKDKSSKTSAS